MRQNSSSPPGLSCSLTGQGRKNGMRTVAGMSFSNFVSSIVGDAGCVATWRTIAMPAQFDPATLFRDWGAPVTKHDLPLDNILLKPTESIVATGIGQRSQIMSYILNVVYHAYLRSC